MEMDYYNKIIDFIRNLYKTEKPIPLHTPVFIGNEKKYLLECIDTTFVSSVGKYVNQIERDIAKFSGTKYAVATMNGTAALHIALLLSGVSKDDEVIMQPLTFIATANAITYCRAKPVFVDVDKETLGLSPNALEEFLNNNVEVNKNGFSYNKLTKRRIKACVPMHTFGHPCKIDEIVKICNKYHIEVIEDAAESIGSLYRNKMTGTFGKFGIYSFNGNKTITSGGGGIILTNDETLAKKAKHITTTAKVPHPWEYRHDMIAYNYRMPNINAALAVAQLEQIEKFIKIKRKIANHYEKFFQSLGIKFITEPKDSKSNYWLNAIILKDRNQRDEFLRITNNNGIMTRPIWILINKLEMYKSCQTYNISNAKWLEDRVVNLPSSVIL